MGNSCPAKCGAGSLPARRVCNLERWGSSRRLIQRLWLPLFAAGSGSRFIRDHSAREVVGRGPPSPVVGSGRFYSDELWRGRHGLRLGRAPPPFSLCSGRPPFRRTLARATRSEGRSCALGNAGSSGWRFAADSGSKSLFRPTLAQATRSEGRSCALGILPIQCLPLRGRAAVATAEGAPARHSALRRVIAR